MKKRIIAILLICIMSISVIAGCSPSEKVEEKPAEVASTDQDTTEKEEEKEEAEEAEIDEAEAEEAEEASNDEIPTLGIGYMFSNHQTPLIVAAAKNEEFSNEDVYLKEVVSREKYVLMSGEDELANIDVVVADNGGEVMTMMTQNHLQLGLSSIGLPLTTIDKGHKMKVLGPIHVDGIGLVMDKDTTLDGFEDFVEYVKESEEPVKIGYHSPANAPVILFEKAIKDMDLTVTENPEDLSADILLINLKGTANLIPALLSKEVDGWVGPSPFPELATVENSGKVVFDLKDLPPEGEWHNFPCCVFSANTDTIEKYPNEIEQFYKLLTIASNYANENKDETGQIVADWMGVSEEAAKNSITEFTTDANEQWLKNAEVTFNSLKDSDKFSGDISGKSFEEIMGEVFDLSFAKKVINQ